MIKSTSYTLESGERYYSQPTDLPLDISSMRDTRQNVNADDGGFWTYTTINDTSGQPHKMKFAAVCNRHLTNPGDSTEPLAATIIWIKSGS